MQERIYRTAESILGNADDRSRVGNLIFGILKSIGLIPKDKLKEPLTPGLK